MNKNPKVLISTLEWDLEWGPFLDTLYKRADKGEVVQALEDRPDMLPGLDMIYHTFLQLSVRRPSGFDVGFIPVSEMNSYLDLLRIDDSDQRLDYFEHWCLLDMAYISYQQKKQKKIDG